MTPAGKGQNQFYFTFLEAQITIRNSFLVCKQGKLRPFGLLGFSLGPETGLAASIPVLPLELSCAFSMEMSVYIWRQISGCLGRLFWQARCGDGHSRMLWLWRELAPLSGTHAPEHRGEGASDPREGQERSPSSDQTGRRVPAEVMTNPRAHQEKQILDFAASAVLATSSGCRCIFIFFSHLRGLQGWRGRESLGSAPALAIIARLAAASGPAAAVAQRSCRTRLVRADELAGREPRTPA